jgi:hypothetical protein
MAGMYHGAVAKWGQPAYDNAQKEACKVASCDEKEK